jgi:hypothetical protein
MPGEGSKQAHSFCRVGRMRMIVHQSSDKPHRRVASDLIGRVSNQLKGDCEEVLGWVVMESPSMGPLTARGL